ncbi:hypothetical protein M011DRAFT_4935 [Sporormia fimetaria CBS 119925]|uniref:P-loop containing nucleoside triphosphate hydrolase protein n=1 Tax=Sporormia fimetaria CBS 119925 TaxID=1340428 RepID=A0A6A6VRB7_9PLEO|nr:hypothetical protein M011DRAFT_4935 [Sporormia fimetaria CBS 119925]
MRESMPEFVPSLDQYRAMPKLKAPPQSASSYNRIDMTKNHPWPLLPVTVIESKVERLFKKGELILERASPTDKEIVAFKDKFRLIREASLYPGVSISINGLQGLGKSSLLNAMMGRTDIADTSGLGEACTKFPVRYIPRLDRKRRSGVSDTKINFMGEADISEMLTRLIRQYHCFHLLRTEEDGHSHDDKEQASEAKAIFEIIFDCENDPRSKQELDTMLNSVDLDIIGLHQRALQLALKRIEHTGVDAYSIRAKSKLGDDGVKEERAQAAKLWPLVEVMTVQTGGRLARHHICLLDAPGLGDCNQTRVAIANAARRQTDYEFIVEEATRPATKMEFLRIVRRSIEVRGEEKTVLVFNNIDDITDNTLYKHCKASDCEPFASIAKRLQEIKHDEAKPEPDDADDDSSDDNFDDSGDYNPSDEDSDEEEKVDKSVGDANSDSVDAGLPGYRKFLLNIARRAYIRFREDTTKSSIQKQLNCTEALRMFSVSADRYNQALADLGTASDWTPEMTGIPALVQLAYSLAADANFQNVERNCLIKIPDIGVHMLGRILEKHGGDQSYDQACEWLRATYASLKRSIRNDFSLYMQRGIPNIWLNQFIKQECLEIVLAKAKQWLQKLHWVTVSKVMRDNGIPIKSTSKAFETLVANLNKVIQQAMQPQLLEWENKLRNSLSELATGLGVSLETFTCRMLHRLGDLGTNKTLKHRVLDAWKAITIAITEDIKIANKDFEDAASAIHKQISAEEDIRCIIAKLNEPIYFRATKVDRGTGFNKRQIEAFLSGLRDPDENGKRFVDRYEDRCLQITKDILLPIFKKHGTALIAKLKEFPAVMQDLVRKTDDLSEEDLALREELRELHKEFVELDEYLRDVFDKARRMEKVKPSGQPKQKRVKTE